MPNFCRCRVPGGTYFFFCSNALLLNAIVASIYVGYCEIFEFESVLEA